MVFKVRSEGTSKELAKHRWGGAFWVRQNMECLCREFRLLEPRGGDGKRSEESRGPIIPGL